MNIKGALWLRAPVGANLFARDGRMNSALPMTHALTHVWSFRQSLPRQGIPGEWRSPVHNHVDRDDDPPWPLGSGTPCRNDGNTSMCEQGCGPDPIPTFPLPGEKALPSTGRGLVPRQARSASRALHGSTACLGRGTKVHCMGDSNGRQLRSVTSLGTDETGRTGVQPTYGV
jgi:hypothetical protein